MKLTKKIRNSIIAGFAVFCALIIGLTLGMTVKAEMESRELLEESITSQLLAISKAAIPLIPGDLLDGFNTLDDISKIGQKYEETNEKMTPIAESLGADGLYVVVKRKEGGETVYRFVYDIDDEDDPFSIYGELEQFQIDAFSGTETSGVMNLQDEFGTFNSAAIPIYDSSNKIVGILCVDIEDQLFKQTISQFNFNITLLAVILVLTLAAFGTVLYFLLRSVSRMQTKLQKLANYDRLTDLPNRRFLLDQLAEMTSPSNKKRVPFALYFIDMDNFKKVNDNAGHDAGDELLRHVAIYLQSAQKNSKVFRPEAGSLNVAARVGGDEFVLITPWIETAEQAEAFAAELLHGFAHEEVDKYVDRYEVGLSIGVALYPFNTENYHVLIKYADIAMYHAKRAGKNRYMVYHDEMKPKEEK